MTPRQAELLEYIRVYQDEHPYSPSYTDMMKALGWKSKSRVHAVLTALHDMGRIRVHFRRARSVEILPDPQSMEAQVLGAVKVIRAAGYVMPTPSELADYLETSPEIVETALVGDNGGVV